ncbi:hypothetical protein C8R45DRAFT_942060 [Mycena sanguinolenta]|nr:hypothetical protein C8R45DRAFT_942060 [Mycena sanguinolenta]
MGQIGVQGQAAGRVSASHLMLHSLFACTSSAILNQTNTGTVNLQAGEEVPAGTGMHIGGGPGMEPSRDGRRTLQSITTCTVIEARSTAEPPPSTDFNNCKSPTRERFLS